MAEEDFDAASLAAYLHLDPAKVTRLAERGKIPGRKVGGTWRFARAEIHHWMEDRIGDSDDAQELASMEGTLRRTPGISMQDVHLPELLPREAIDVSLQARSQSSVITRMCDLAAGTGMLWDASEMAEAVRQREAMHPTALDNGVALLHPRRPLGKFLAQPFVAFGRTVQGIPFGGSRGVLTDLFFLLCSTDDVSHLCVLARLSRLINIPDFLSELRAAEDVDAVLEVVRRHDASLD